MLELCNFGKLQKSVPFKLNCNAFSSFCPHFSSYYIISQFLCESAYYISFLVVMNFYKLIIILLVFVPLRKISI